ncbi:hypothetical protein GCM10010271_72750 [Streptomyces kurssanovii]|nr:hypothetical protein GCM10010271_72750 [Streptomyces kurssanovii]
MVGAGCSITGGKWLSYYDGQRVTLASALDIEHMVPLAEAWDSGASGWSAAQREAYANDQGAATSLVAVTARTNRSKADQDPAEWLPPASDRYCRYIGEWIGTKLRWGGGEFCLVAVATPNGKTRMGYSRSFDWGTEGFRLGGSINIGSLRSNADDIGQLAGMGHDAGGSLKIGPGVYGDHETATGTTNSKGQQVSTIEAGSGWGIGADLYNGFNRTWSDWL